TEVVLATSRPHNAQAELYEKRKQTRGAVQHLATVLVVDRVHEPLHEPQAARRRRPLAGKGDRVDRPHAGDTSNAATVVLLQLLRHRREELPRDRGVLLDEWLEVPRGHAVAEHVGLGGDRRRAVGAGQERDLAEVVAGADRVSVLAVDEDVALALVDDEEARAARALFDDVPAGSDATLAHRTGDLLELALLEARKQRDPLQHVDSRPRHAAVIHPTRGARSARILG